MCTIVNKSVDEVISTIEATDSWTVNIYFSFIRKLTDIERYEIDILTDYIYKSSGNHSYRLILSGVLNSAVLKMISVLRSVIDIEILDNTIYTPNTDWCGVQNLIKTMLEEEDALVVSKYNALSLSDLRKLIL